MRWILAAMAIGLSPALAQDRPAQSELKSTPPLDAALTHMCSGDMIAPASATILTGYGEGGFPIRTSSPKAQAFFDNGMQLAHAFAHQAAIQAFREASRLDPDCAMCLWGEAWAAGPTINFPIEPADVTKLAALVDRADKLAVHAPPRDRALIAALKLRYRDGGGTGAGDQGFARAMDALAIQYPADDEIAVIAADAWMIPPSLAGRWGGKLERAVALLEAVLKRNLKVGLINLDSYKVAAFDQLDTYAKILNIPFRGAATAEEPASLAGGRRSRKAKAEPIAVAAAADAEEERPARRRKTA